MQPSVMPGTIPNSVFQRRASSRRTNDTAAIVWAKRANVHCNDHLASGTSYYGLAAAEAACAASTSCFGVYDTYCDGTGSFYLCQASDTWSESYSSCIYEKTTPTGNGSEVGPGSMTAVSWEKEEDTHCYSSRDVSVVYSTLNDAETACAADSDCSGVYDNNCDNSGSFYKCMGDDDRWHASMSSCVYRKVMSTQCQLTLQISRNYQSLIAPSSFDALALQIDSQTTSCSINYPYMTGD